MNRYQFLFLQHGLMRFSLILLTLIPGILSSRLVTLDSIEIFTTHDWFPSKPTVYFSCKDENKTILPDVKKTDFMYVFKGKESWQPLVELPEQKCKRCGIYEMDTYKSDDLYDEWEMCSDDFIKGKYQHFKEGEFNATFLCPDCDGSASTAHNSTAVPEDKKEGENKNNNKVILIAVLSVLGSVLVIIASVFVYKYMQKRKREHDQLRFLKLFEEGDEIEDEIALGHVI